jgi:hypothetical protein
VDRGQLRFRALPGRRSSAARASPVSVGPAEESLTAGARPRGGAALLVGSATAAATVALFLFSRGKWADAIIDTGNEWLWPDALVRGELLYRDVVYWFGPLTPYFHAAVFALFGSSFESLVIAGAVASLATLAALFAALRLVTGRLEAALWSALAIPLLVFMPFSGGSLLGMGYRMWHAAALTLVALSVAFSPRRARWRPWVAGACVGLAALCRADWGLMAFLALAAGLARRGPNSRDASRAVFRTALAAAAVFLAVMLPFVAAAAGRFFTESFVFLVGLPEETRRSALGWTGLRRWPWGIWSWIYAASVWLSAYGLVELAALRRAGPRPDLRRLAPAAYAILGILLAGAIVGPRAGSLLFAWTPVADVAAVAAGWRRGRRGALLVACGIVGLLGAARRIFDLRDFGYVAPPTLFALVCAAGLLRLAMRRAPLRAPTRARLARFVRPGIVLLVAAAFLHRGSQYAADARVPVPGTGGYLTASPVLAAALEIASREVREGTPTGASLVAFPDGAVLNFLSDRPNPFRHKLYVAGFLRASNEETILRELERQPPAAVVILDRPDGHEPPRVFGVDYGSRVRRWLEERYDLRPLTETRPDPAGFPLLLGFPRPAPTPSYNPGP